MRACVRALKEKRPELSTPNFVHIYCMAVAQQALTRRSKGQRSRSHGYENRHGPWAASEECCRGRVLLHAAGMGPHVVRLLLVSKLVFKKTRHGHISRQTYGTGRFNHGFIACKSNERRYGLPASVRYRTNGARPKTPTNHQSGVHCAKTRDFFDSTGLLRFGVQQANGGTYRHRDLVVILYLTL